MNCAFGCVNLGRVYLGAGLALTTPPGGRAWRQIDGAITVVASDRLLLWSGAVGRSLAVGLLPLLPLLFGHLGRVIGSRIGLTTQRKRPQQTR